MRTITKIANRLTPILLMCTLCTMALAAEKTAPLESPDIPNVKPQSNSIKQIFDREKNPAYRTQITELVNYIDETYRDLPEKLKTRKMIIFIDPAHGILPNGEWQGGRATNRLSCTGLPEEYYSIQLTRALYTKLSRNKFIEIRTTDDYLKVLKGESDRYRDIPFPTTVKMAREAGAFIIISEHLNNVAIFHKADGMVNILGLHITRDLWGRKMLRYINGSYSGFLTLYNKFDASGFSRSYALNLKRHLIDHGMKPNNWDFGAVADSRFSYFLDFPVSIIYESGFISNPDEEKKLREPATIELFATAQYDSLIETIRDNFGIDISGSDVKTLGITPDARIDILKLARMALFYIKRGETAKAITVIDTMERGYGVPELRQSIQYYTGLREYLIGADRYYRLALRKKSQKRWREARSLFATAHRLIMSVPVFGTYHRLIAGEMASASSPAMATESKPAAPKPPPAPVIANRAAIETPIILTIDDRQTMNDAIRQALEPDAPTFKKLAMNFSSPVITMKKSQRSFNKKQKRWVTTAKMVHQRFYFDKGIYIVTLDRSLSLTSARKVESVYLDPAHYQNQQYMKNSAFANGEKIREL